MDTRINMDISAVRREKLRRYLKSNRLKAVELADLIEKSPAQLNSLIGKNPRRNIGGVLAREIEAKLGKPHGWMDILQVGDTDEISTSAIRIEPYESGDIKLPSGQSAFKEPILAVSATDQWIEVNLRADPECVRIMSAAGQAMAKSINHGDLLFINKDVKTYNGDGVYILRIGDEQLLTVKRLERGASGVTMRSDNTSISRHEVPIDDFNVEIHGRVLASMVLNKF